MKRAFTIVVGICLSIIVYVGVSASYPFDPVMDNTDKYSRHYRLTTSLPFLTSYLLLVPPGYDPARKYPLVLALHGGYKRSAGAYFAAHADFQNRHQSFVLMPMALLGEPWVESDETGKGGVRPSDSLRLAMDILHDVVADFVPFIMKLLLSREQEPLPPLIDGFATGEVALHLGYIQDFLGDKPFLLGDTLQGPDIGITYILQLAQRVGDLGPYPALEAYRERMMSRPAFQRARERAGE
ncbi:MAG: hypothetical protein VCC99_15475 [Alphaproteobacteria bacterium]